MAYGRTELPSSYREDAPPHGLYNCCCCLSFSLLLFFLILIGIALFFLLVMKPSQPGFTLDSATLQSFHVDNNPIADNTALVYLSMNVTLIFSATNPNKVSIVYSPTKLNCLYKDALLGVASVPSFTQPAHSHTILTAVVGVNHLNVLQPSSLDLFDDATLHDKVTLYINGPVEAHVKVLSFDSPKVKALVNCGIVIRPQEGEIAEKKCNVGQLTLSD